MASFQDIVGQEQIKEHLQHGIKLGKISHAYIINGERSSGKEFIANLFAMTLQCEKGEEEPCNICHSCKQALSGNQPDIIHVTHEKPNTISVNDIREQINQDIGIKPYSSKYKIYIVNEAEKMNVQAQNALLKTLEEPPAYGIIILLTTNIDALLSTILSRCVVLNMKPVSDQLIRQYLMQTMQIPDYKADVCVAFARGNVGKAKHLCGNEDFEKIKNEASILMKNIKEMDNSDLVRAVKEIIEYKLDIHDYLDMIAVWHRDVLLFKATRDANSLIFKEEIQYIRKVADRSTYEGINTVINALDQAKKRLDANVSLELTMELLLLTIQENI